VADSDFSFSADSLEQPSKAIDKIRTITDISKNRFLFLGFNIKS
jgi:hypothetical protein